MAEPLGRLSVGDAIPTRQTTWNAILDAARAYRVGGGRPQQGAIVDNSKPESSLEILVRNDTGGNLLQGSIVEIRESLISLTDFPSEANYKPFFEAIKPTREDCFFAVLRDPIVNGQFGAAMIFGPAVCQLDVVDTDHQYARVVTGDSTYLRSSSVFGPAKILWKTTGTGTQTAIVGLQLSGAERNATGYTLAFNYSFSDTVTQWSFVTTNSTVGEGTGLSSGVLTVIDRDLYQRNGARGIAGTTEDFTDDFVTEGGWAVAVEDIPPRSYGVVAVSGRTIVKVTGNRTGKGYLCPGGTDRMIPAHYGLNILWIEPGTGDRYAIVELSPQRQPPGFVNDPTGGISGLSALPVIGTGSDFADDSWVSFFVTDNLSGLRSYRHARTDHAAVVLSVLPASGSQRGTVKIGSGISVTADGVISVSGGGITSIDSGTPTTLTGYIAGDGSTLGVVSSIPYSDLSGLPTTLSGYGITDAQPIDPDLTSLAAATGTNTIYYRSGAGTWSAATIGSGLSFTGGTLAASGGGGSGTVTSIAITNTGSGAIAVTGSPITTSGTITLDLNNDSITTAKLVNASVTYAKMQQIPATSVLGRDANSLGDVGAISASADGQVLVRRSGVLTFAPLTSTDLPAGTRVQPGIACAWPTAASVPSGWVEVGVGGTASRTGSAGLYAAYGTAFGAGDGSTTFGLPDWRGRTLIGAGTGSGLTARANLSTGGAETHTLDGTEMPVHTHDSTLVAGGSGSPANVTVGGGGYGLRATSAAGGGVAHANMQPWFATRWITPAN
jgi:microcystin-dependent protein